MSVDPRPLLDETATATSTVIPPQSSFNSLSASDYSTASLPLYSNGREGQVDPLVNNEEDYFVEESEGEDEGEDGEVEGQVAATTSNNISINGPHRHSAFFSTKQPHYRCCGSGFLMTQFQFISSIVLLVLLLVTIIVIVILFAIVPVIIANTVAGTTITLAAINISLPDSATSSMHLTTTMYLTNTGAFAAQLHEADVQISHQLPDGSYSNTIGHVHLDPIYLDGPIAVNLSSTFTITDMKAFDAMVHSLLMDTEVVWHLSAGVEVTPYLGSLSLPTYSDIDFAKDVSIGGCQGLNETYLTIFSLTDSNLTEINLRMTVEIINPSNLTISPLGILHFNISYEGEWIGDVYTTQASLVVGRNYLEMTGQLYDSASSSASQQALIELYLTNRSTNVMAVAAPDASSIALFNGGMQGLTLFTAVPPSTQNLVAALNFSRMILTPSDRDASAMIEADLIIEINSPLGQNTPLTIKTIAMSSTLFFNGESMGTIASAPSPATPIYSGGNNITSVFAVTISGNLLLSGNGSVYSGFVTQFVPGDLLQLSVRGVTDLTAQYVLGNLSATNVPVMAESTLKGFQGLSPIEKSLTITGNHRCSDGNGDCGILISMEASLYNPSYVTFSLDQPSLYLTYQSVVMGKTTANTLVVKPGNNTQLLNGYLYPGPNQSALASTFIDDFIHGIPTTVTLYGSSEGESIGSAAALTTEAIMLIALVPGQDCAPTLIETIELEEFSINFDPANTTSPYTIGCVVRASFALPPNLAMPLTITAASMHADIMANATSVFASLDVHNLSVVHEHHVTPPDYLNMTLVDVPLVVAPSGEAGFQAFAVQLMRAQALGLPMNVLAAPTAVTALGTLMLTNIPGNSTIPILGLNQLRTAEGASLMQVLKYDIVATTPAYMLVQTLVNITSPSNISLFGLGPLTLDLSFLGERIARVTVPDFSLPIGSLTHTAIANISALTEPYAASALIKFLSAMINQSDSAVSLTGALLNPNGTVTPGITIPLLQPAIEALNTSTLFPGIGAPFLLGFNGWLDAGMLLQIAVLGQGTLKTQMHVQNPFSAWLSIVQTVVAVYVNGTNWQIGRWYETRPKGQPMVIGPCLVRPCTSQVSDWFEVTIDMTVDEGEKLSYMLSQAVKGEPMYLTSQGTITAYLSHDAPDIPNNYVNAFKQNIQIDGRDLPCAVVVGLEAHQLRFPDHYLCL